MFFKLLSYIFYRKKQHYENNIWKIKKLGKNWASALLILLANELIQTIIKGKVHIKFEQNQTKMLLLKWGEYPPLPTPTSTYPHTTHLKHIVIIPWLHAILSGKDLPSNFLLWAMQHWQCRSMQESGIRN